MLRQMPAAPPATEAILLARAEALAGHTLRWLAEREGVSLSGAKSRIQRGRQNLEALIRSCCDIQLDRRGNIVDYTPKNCESGDC